MRFLTALFLWLVTTALLAVTVPSLWLQHNVIDQAGYSVFSAAAAKDPLLQHAVAGELTTQVQALAARRGAQVDVSMVRRVANGYTAGESFPEQFARANEIAHTWVFTDRVARDSRGWVVDLAPMLSDASFRDTLSDFDIEVPQTFTVPITASPPAGLQPGRLRLAAVWGPWLSIGVAALLTLAAARSRGKAFAALGVSALLVGAAGWAGLEVSRRYVNEALNHTTGDIRQIADVMVGHAIDSLHHWLNLTLAGGAGLVVFGVIVAMLGGLLRRG